MTYRKAYCKISKMMDKAFGIIDRQNKLIEDLQSKNKMEICKYQRQVTLHEDSVRLLDSYMETNARQAQDIIELESVAIALYDYVWHHVHSVEDELKNHEGVTDLNAYKTIKALFEAEGDAE